MDDFATRLLRFCGREKFNKFLAAFQGPCKEKNALMFWQEQLLTKFCHEEGISPVPTWADLQTSFEEVEKQRLSLGEAGVTLPMFVADPLGLWDEIAEEIPVDWFREAWRRNAAFKDMGSYALSRSVSKTGSFDLATEWVSYLSQVITPEDAVDLYLYIRDNSQRLENEWRPSFLEWTRLDDSVLPDRLFFP